jgi:hypothetical protein
MKILTVFLTICLLVLNACASTENAKGPSGSSSNTASPQAKATGKPIDILVYRSPTCGCCKKWMAHLEDNNFNVTEIRTGEVQAIKDKYGVSKELASCHTAIVDGYVVEGHVPANDIEVLLKTRPKVVGISVPAMPIGTPGMEMGDEKEAYDVISFDREKHEQIVNHYKGN